MSDEIQRNIGSIKLPQWGRVERDGGTVPWLVYDDAGEVVEPVRRYLADCVARDHSPASVRSYAYGLLRWWRWLRVLEVNWDKATPAEGRDLVLWLTQAPKLRRAPRTKSKKTAGTVNTRTRKRYLDDRYAARTIRHSNAVVRAFYEFWNETGQGPVLNPIPLDRRSPWSAIHPADSRSLRPAGRIRYNPKLPKQQPRALTDEQWKELFDVLRSNRDRALLSLVVGNGARASEVLRVRPVDIDWGEQLIRVTRKGTRAEQWLPASQESFVWLRLYLADLGEALSPHEVIWKTRRRRDCGNGLHRQPLNYEALRKVFTRANEVLGTNWTMHDLRHTAALRMVRDTHLSARDVQLILGHAHLSTTAEIYLIEDQAEVVRRVQHHLATRGQHVPPPIPAAPGYDAADLAVLLGRTPS